MSSAIDNALSGLAAASTRVAVASNNIANQNSTKAISAGTSVDKPYVPQQVDQVSLSGGGVQASVRDQAQQSTDAASANANNTNDQASQLAQLNIASYDFKANAKVIKIQQNLDQALLDIKS